MGETRPTLAIATYPAEEIAAVKRETGRRDTGVPSATAAEHDLFLRAVVLHNRGERPLDIERVEIGIASATGPVREIAYGGGALDARLHAAAALLAGLPPPLVPFIFGGDAPASAAALGRTRGLEPGQRALLMNEHQRVDSDAPLDRMRITVVYRGAATETASCALRVVYPEAATPLRFPLRGPTLVWNAYDNVHVLSHRRLQSQEFALDLVGLHPDQRYHPDSRANADYVGYGAAVRAVAAGTVVRALDGVPENPRGGELLPAEEQARIASERGPFALLVGNHVILRHAGGRHSLYVHLRPGSVGVAPGDEVDTGSTLGELGNAGLSGGPHLHFALMDGPDPVTARGIPPRFVGLRHLVWGDTVDVPLESHWLVEDTGA